LGVSEGPTSVLHKEKSASLICQENSNIACMADRFLSTTLFFIPSCARAIGGPYVALLIGHGFQAVVFLQSCTLFT
jgi:hypothetical protein